MSFRSKSPERALDELASQAKRYRSFRFEAVDNIMDMAYLTKLFPVLVENEMGYEIFYEVKGKPETGAAETDGAGWRHSNPARH